MRRSGHVSWRSICDERSSSSALVNLVRLSHVPLSDHPVPETSHEFRSFLRRMDAYIFCIRLYLDDSRRQLLRDIDFVKARTADNPQRNVGVNHASLAPFIREPVHNQLTYMTELPKGDDEGRMHGSHVGVSHK